MLRRVHMLPGVIAAVWVIAALLAASGQQPPAEDTSDKIKVEVKQVLVPVVVTDRKGHNVTGLKKGDFSVFEDGVRQQLVAFSTEMVDASAPARPDPPAAQPPSPVATPTARPVEKASTRRTYLICLDTLNSALENYSAVRKSLAKLFQQERSSDAQYGLVTLGRSAFVVSKLTRDPEDILAALQRQQLDQAVQHDEISNLTRQDTELQKLMDRYCQQRCPCNSPAVGGSVANIDTTMADFCKHLLRTAMSFAGSAAQQRSVLERDHLRYLRSVVAELGRQPGKRVLLLVSDGFSLWAGHDLFALIGAYLGDSTLNVRSNADSPGSEFQAMPAMILQNPGARLDPDLEEVTRLATSLDVVVYTLDSRGLPAPTFGIFDQENPRSWLVHTPQAVPEMVSQRSLVDDEKRDPLVQLAAATGGVFVANSNDLLRGMRQAFVDGREYYVLAYVPGNRASDGKFRKIHVEVQDGKLAIHAKSGYWAPVSPNPPADKAPASGRLPR